MRMLCARMASARSFARLAICRTFTPGAGSTSNCVTVGPVVRPTSSPSTRKVRSASISFTPAWSSSRRLVSAQRGGGGLRSSTGGSSSATTPVTASAASISAAIRSTCSASDSAFVRRPRRRAPAAGRSTGSVAAAARKDGSTAGISSGAGASRSAASAGAPGGSSSASAPAALRFRRPRRAGSASARYGASPGELAAPAASPASVRCPIRTRIGFHASVAAVSADAASESTIHDPAVPNARCR
jgi:hypothetical protein